MATSANFLTAIAAAQLPSNATTILKGKGNNMIPIYQQLSLEQRKALANRWESIREKAERNMRYGNGGSYASVRVSSDGESLILPSLEKDKVAIKMIDTILKDILK